MELLNSSCVTYKVVQVILTHLLSVLFGGGDGSKTLTFFVESLVRFILTRTLDRIEEPGP